MACLIPPPCRAGGAEASNRLLQVPACRPAGLPAPAPRSDCALPRFDRVLCGVVWCRDACSQRRVCGRQGRGGRQPGHPLSVPDALQDGPYARGSAWAQPRHPGPGHDEVRGLPGPDAFQDGPYALGGARASQPRHPGPGHDEVGLGAVRTSGPNRPFRACEPLYTYVARARLA